VWFVWATGGSGGVCAAGSSHESLVSVRASLLNAQKSLAIENR